MADLLIDTSVIIDFLRGHPPAAGFIQQTLLQDRPLLHPLIAAEVLDGARDRRELNQFDKALAALTPVVVDAADWDEALDIFRANRLSHGVGWPDCLLAATCLRLSVAIATLNVKHFRPIAGLKVLRPY
jgi:predicted nucleic acid-binding protein